MLAAPVPSIDPPISPNVGYSERNDQAKRREIRRLPLGANAGVYGDPSGNYRFTLTPAGRANASRALVALFVPQPPHKRTPIHCDYFVSLVHHRAFADSLGETEFNHPW